MSKKRKELEMEIAPQPTRLQISFFINLFLWSLGGSVFLLIIPVETLRDQEKIMNEKQRLELPALGGDLISMDKKIRN
jgi:hypothetical protein